MIKKLLLLTVLGLAVQTTMAERADSLKRGTIEAESSDIDNVTRTTLLNGNVILTRGTLLMKADKAQVREDVDGNQFVTMTAGNGGNVSFRQKRDGGTDLWVEGQAQRIEYDGDKELVKLFTKAKIKELEGTKVMKEAGGEFIAYDSRKETVAVRNDASGETKPGKGRTIIMLEPQLPKPAAAGK
jgi:lipopolysaccharide export system protein LptA